MKKAVYLFIGFLLPSLCFANDAVNAFFKAGNDAYAKGQYKEALVKYQKAVDAGYQSSALYFNMGNASYKNDDIASAVLYYEKAHKLSPGDEDINFNLRYVNLKTTDKIDEVPEFFLARWWKGFVLALSVSTLSVLSILFILLASGLLILYFFTNSVSVKKASFYGAIVLFVIGLFTVFIGTRQVGYFERHREAIVFSGSVTVKSSPVDKSGNLFVIHNGTKVNILDNNNGWMKIRLVNGNEGWIKAADVKEI